jgi:hypothetical protein
MRLQELLPDISLDLLLKDRAPPWFFEDACQKVHPKIRTPYEAL